VGKGKRSKVRELEVAPAAERHDFAYGILGHESSYTINVSEQIALAVSTFYGCVRMIADLVSDGDINEFRGAEILPPSRIVLRPQVGERPHVVTRRTWLWLVASSMAIYNGVYLLERGGRDSEGMPYSVVPIAPPRVSHDLDGWRIDGELVNERELIYIPRATFPTVYGSAAYIVTLARDAIAAAWAASAYSADFWQAGGAPVLYISTEQPLTNAQATEISDNWAERRNAAPGKPAVVGRGGKVQTLGADASQTGTTAAAEAIGKEIAQYLGVPAWLANVPSAAGSLVYQNSAAAGLDLVRYNLRPGYAGPIGDAWSDLLPGSYITGRRVVIGLDHLTEGTVLEQYQAYQIATGSKAWMMPSEIRTKTHLPIDMTLDEAGTPAPAMEAIPNV
jgi:hypothetical protein